MSYELYRYIFIGGLVLSVLMLVLAVILFFTMDIKKLIGEYNGSTRRKAIEKIRKKSSGEIAITGQTVTKNKPVVHEKKPKKAVDTNETSKIRPQDRYDSFEAPETTTLSDYSQQAEVPQAVNSYQPVYVQRDDFIIETDITFVHSSEVIV